MNPNTPQPSFELPTPLSGPEESKGTAEHGAARVEQTAQPPAALPPVNHAQASSLAQAGTSPLPHDPQQQTPMLADDSDLIEKEWVEKAKRIVSSTSQDPYTQNRELSRFKADYMKKRYNKDIKLDES